MATHYNKIVDDLGNIVDAIAYYEKDGVKSTHFVSGATSKSIYEDEFDKNEEKRRIKIIRPNMVGRIVSQFEKVMKS